MAEYTNIRVRPEVAAQVRTVQRQLAARADRDVSMSDTLAAVLAYASHHVPDIAAILGPSGADPGKENRR